MNNLFIKTLLFSVILAANQAVYSLPPMPPSLDVSMSGLDVTALWTSAPGATGYELFYAPCPNVEYINSIDMESQTGLSVRLWEDAAFYVAVQSYNSEGNSDYSNIEHFGCGCLALPLGLINLAIDEKPHEEPMEWWYWTGHLQTEDGRWFGFEQVVFLMKVNGQTMQIAHHAITDIEDGSFHYAVTPPQLAVLPELDSGFNWDVNGLTAKGGGGSDVLHGEVDNYVLDLKLETKKPAVFQHGNGFSEYSFGGYTYYYSYERMAAKGTLKVGDEDLAVTGSAWFDHQWGDLTNLISLGWDWFAIQLDDDREIMLFNGKDVFLGGSDSDANCQVSDIDADDVEIISLGEWTSPHTNCTYPQGWTVRVGDLNLTITPVMAEQEVIAWPEIYWEGAAVVSGDATGRAYVELAGYCDQ